MHLLKIMHGQQETLFTVFTAIHILKVFLSQIKYN